MSAQSTYQPIHRIAMGGMAEVHLAYQRGLGGLEKLVVVKRILPHLEGDATFVTMFLEEARLAAQLSHPNVVNVVDVRREDDGLYMVMEYLAGIDLRQLLALAKGDERSVPIPVTLRALADAADGLHYAHCARDSHGQPLGLVHRDVTPSNIMLTFEGVTKVLDFGIAKAAGPAGVTQGGTVRGQFTYCSPEQIEQRPLDARSDVFSLGVVLYELLTGASPFVAESPAGVMQAVMHRQIFPPGAMNSDVPVELDDLVMRALARDPAARISNAGELRDRLYSILGGYGTTMSPARMGRWIRERFSDEWRAAQKLEQRVTLQARAGEATARPSSHLSVSASISTPGDLLDTTQVTTHPSVSSAFESGSDSISPLGDVAAGRGSNLTLYMAAAVAATVSILAVLALAYFLGRTAG